MGKLPIIKHIANRKKKHHYNVFAKHTLFNHHNTAMNGML